MVKKYLSILIILLSAMMLNSQDMFERDGVKLNWEVRENKLVVTMSGPTTGWLAFGTDASRKMKGADIILVWVDDDMGIAMGEDHFGTGMFSHKNDLEIEGTQDVLVLSGSQSREETTVTFAIPLNSGDEYDTFLERGKTYPLLLATGRNDNIGRKHNWAYTGTITIP